MGDSDFGTVESGAHRVQVALVLFGVLFVGMHVAVLFLAAREPLRSPDRGGCSPSSRRAC